MHASYDDIISRISTPPIWYDEHTVPRYCSFEPGRSASIHIGEIALAEITCQECQRRFRVAFSAVNFQRQTIAEPIHNKGLHFGDPPRHDGDIGDRPACLAGASMMSETRRALARCITGDRDLAQMARSPTKRTVTGYARANLKDAVEKLGLIAV